MNITTVQRISYNPFQRVANWSVKLAFVIALIFGLWLATTPASEVYAQDVVYHTVRSGESLSSIARSYGVTVGTILQNNAIANPNVLRVGQTLAIHRSSQPSAPVPTTPPPAPVEVAPTAQPTQRPTATQEPNTVYIPPVTVPETAPTVERPIPTPTPLVSTLRYYVIRPGDTLNGIAARFGVTTAAIKSRNRLVGDVIYAGQSLAIP